MVGNRFKRVFNVSETKTAEGGGKRGGGKTNVLPLANKQKRDFGDLEFLDFGIFDFGILDFGMLGFRDLRAFSQFRGWG